MIKRNGIHTLIKVAKNLCIAIVKFQHLIRVVTNNDPTVNTALTAALTACQVLEEVLEQYQNVGD